MKTETQNIIPDQSKLVFARETKNGLLSCYTQDSYMNGVCIAFFIGDKEIKQQSIAFINTTESLANEKYNKKIYDNLVEIGASAIWNYQVALFGNEADLIRAALKTAKENKIAEEMKQISESDIVVTEKLYNGSPATAENSMFKWFFGQKSYLQCLSTNRSIYQMAYMNLPFGSEPILDEATINAVKKFWSDLHLIQKYAEIDYAKQVEEKEKSNTSKPNPRLDGLSKDEINIKAQQWDDINNEGGEGFNPYR